MTPPTLNGIDLPHGIPRSASIFISFFKVKHLNNFHDEINSCNDIQLSKCFGIFLTVINIFCFLFFQWIKKFIALERSEKRRKKLDATTSHKHRSTSFSVTNYKSVTKSCCKSDKWIKHHAARGFNYLWD